MCVYIWLLLYMRLCGCVSHFGADHFIFPFIANPRLWLKIYSESPLSMGLLGREETRRRADIRGGGIRIEGA